MNILRYRITFAGGNTCTHLRDEPLPDPLAHFCNRFGYDRIERVELQREDGSFTDSALLPTCQEEADSVNAIDESQPPETYPPLSESERKEIEDWLDGVE